MNSRRYSKFLAGLITSLVIISLFIDPALATAPNNRADEVNRNPSSSNSSIIVSDALTLAPEFTQQALMAAGDTMRVSLNSSGVQGNGESRTPSISADGLYVAFYSYASNLVSGDTNGAEDVFVRDTQTNTTTRVSLNSSGVQGNSDSYFPSISADGRYVAFNSDASNLVSGDTNYTIDVFIHDRQSGQTTRVSVASDGTQGNSSSFWPSISADGRYVAFQSDASNLVSGDTNETWDVFVHDRQSGQTTRVSVASDGTQGNYVSEYLSISANGRYVAFDSYANNLLDGDTNETWDVFVHDRQSGQTTRVSVASDGTQGNSGSYKPSISADGRYITFPSTANNLVGGDTNGEADIFVHDRQSGQTTRVSVASDDTQGNFSSFISSISANGRYVAFDSYANNLVSGDTNETMDVFVHDRQSGQTTRVSIASDDTQGNTNSNYPSISNDGRYVAFESIASNLVSGDTNGTDDVFVHENDVVTLFDDNFNDGNADGWTTSGNGTWYVENGEYVVSMGIGTYLLGESTAGDISWTDIIFEVDIKGDLGVDKAICIRYQGEHCYYSVNVRSDPYNDVNLVGNSGIIEAVPYANSIGTWYHVKVSWQGNNILVNVNNIQLINYSFSETYVMNGKIGLIGWTGGYGSDKVRYDNVKVTTTAYSISGTIWDNIGNPLSNTTIAITTQSGDEVTNVTSALDGSYIVSDLPEGTYLIYPSKEGYTFNPYPLTVILDSDRTGQNFLGSEITCTPATGSGVSSNTVSACIYPTAKPFLDLPFAYTNDFAIVANAKEGLTPGKVTAWVDHDRDPGELWTWGLATYRTEINGISPSNCFPPRSDCYDQHEGTDFSLVEGTPVFPAAPGVVECTSEQKQNCVFSPAYGKWVLINHENGGYATLYAHLNSINVEVGDRFYPNTSPIPLGVSGATLCPTQDNPAQRCPHLHFGLLFDYYNNMKWENFKEEVDPYGWKPLNISAIDPIGRPNIYMWKYPLEVNYSWCSSFETQTAEYKNMSIAFPPGSLTTDTTVTLGIGSLPGSLLETLRSASQTYFLSLIQWTQTGGSNKLIAQQLSSDSALPIPASLTLNYDPIAVLHLDESQLKIRRWDDISSSWLDLPNTIDNVAHMATVQTDSAGQFDLQAPLLCPADTLEVNDNYEMASVVKIDGIPISNLFDIVQDEDWFQFDAVIGNQYDIQTSSLATGVDTALEIYDTDGVTLLVADDNSGGGSASSLTWQAPQDGLYFARVVQASGSSFGCGATYNFAASVVDTGVYNLFLPLILR